MNNSKKISKKAYSSLNNYINNTSNVSPVLANLVLLGHVSAVESYFREMFRRTILIDEDSQIVRL